METNDDLRRHGLRIIRIGIATAVLLAVGLTAWIVDKALSNPDVRAKRPGWLDAAVGFDVSYWIPLSLTVVVGVGLVLFVFARAYRRIRRGEDLYADRFGRGVRRRREQHIHPDSEQP